MVLVPVVTIADPRGMVNRVLETRLMRWIGRLSYSLYLWQQLFAYGDRHRPWYFVLCAVGLASASYYLVEQPLLRVRERRMAARKMERTLATAA